MPGDEPKGQHFVHRAYLEGFVDPEYEKRGETCLWVYMPPKGPFRQKPERVGKRNYYYCYKQEDKRRFHIEHGIQVLEDAALPIIVKLRNKEFTLTQDERVTLAGYVALAHTRVPTFEREVNRLAALTSARQVEDAAKNPLILEELARDRYEETGEAVDPEIVRRDLTSGSVVAIQTNRAWSLGQMFKAMMGIQGVAFAMKWTFIVAPDGDPGFITSDNPVCRFNSSSGNGGYFTFPLGRSVALVAQDWRSAMTMKVSSATVRGINKRTVIQADTQLYSPFHSQAIQKLFEEATKNRTRPRRVLVRKGIVVEE